MINVTVDITLETIDQQKDHIHQVLEVIVHCSRYCIELTPVVLLLLLIVS